MRQASLWLSGLGAASALVVGVHQANYALTHVRNTFPWAIAALAGAVVLVSLGVILSSCARASS
jgi:hypothetical protein